MWDTSKDYRLKVAEKSVELFIRTTDGAGLKGNWSKKKAQDAARGILPEIQYLYYSYLTPREMAGTQQLETIQVSLNEIIEHLGGKSWVRQFSDMASREDKEKLEEALAKIKFVLNIFSGLKGRLMLGEINDPIIGIDIKKGVILSVSHHPVAENLLICNLNLGERAITVVTNELSVREGDEVAVALLPPENFMGITSEGMFLGDSEGVLKYVDGEIGKLPQRIPLESFNETRNLVEAFLK
jgi:predicted RNA-binding protein with EMAP domain